MLKTKKCGISFLLLSFLAVKRDWSVILQYELAAIAIIFIPKLKVTIRSADFFIVCGSLSHGTWTLKLFIPETM